MIFLPSGSFIELSLQNMQLEFYYYLFQVGVSCDVKDILLTDGNEESVTSM